MEPAHVEIHVMECLLFAPPAAPAHNLCSPHAKQGIVILSSRFFLLNLAPTASSSTALSVLLAPPAATPARSAVCWSLQQWRMRGVPAPELPAQPSPAASCWQMLQAAPLRSCQP